MPEAECEELDGQERVMKNVYTCLCCDCFGRAKRLTVSLHQFNCNLLSDTDNVDLLLSVME